MHSYIQIRLRTLIKTCSDLLELVSLNLMGLYETYLKIIELRKEKSNTRIHSSAEISASPEQCGCDNDDKAIIKYEKTHETLEQSRRPNPLLVTVTNRSTKIKMGMR